MDSAGQRGLFPDLPAKRSASKPVNVSSVPQRSPFRYPGGKTWFVPTFRQWIRSVRPRPRTLVEPFAGGGIISLTALFEDLVERAVMVELDDEVASVWQTIVDGRAEWLAKRVREFDLTKENAVRELSKTPKTVRDKAFHTILKNRTFHGGILAPGSGFLKYGEKGKGIRSRWYASTIAKRLIALNLVAHRIDFRCSDGIKMMETLSDEEDTAFFIDPPYTAGGKKAGKRLYKHYDLDHERLFRLCESIKGVFLMTYDDADEVKDMARSHGFEMRLIPMTNTHHATMEELVIGRDLSWTEELPIVRDPGLDYGVSIKRKRDSTPTSE